MDAVITITVLTVGILGMLFAFHGNVRATRDIGDSDHARSALENAVEVLKSDDFAGLYDKYHGTRLAAPKVLAPDSTPASVLIEFDVDETTLAPEYGPVADIDGDGQRRTRDASGAYELLPARLTLEYLLSSGPERKVIFLVLGAQ